MIFSAPLYQAVLDGKKTVTRRLAKGPCRYTVGRPYAVQWGRGRKSGAQIEISAIVRECLGTLSAKEAHAEGFSSVEDFTAYWTALHGDYDPNTWVDVIRFCLVEES